METILYVLKSAIILSLFYSVYYIVLRKDTFFITKRHFLIGGIISAILLPLLVFTNTVYETAPVSEMVYVTENIIPNTINETEALTIDAWQIALFIYLAGVVFMLFRFIKQISSLFTLITTYASEKIEGYHYIKVNNQLPPFSFFKYIVYNPELHSEEETKMILKHEQVHATQWHSIDMVLANFLLIFQWMNPFAWLFKKSMEENLEFLADSETIQNVSCKKTYQLTLVKTSTSQHQLALTNNFYQSFIKKRIIMLHKNESKSFHQFKLLLVLPFLALFLWSFNLKEEVRYIETTAEEIPSFYFSENLPEETTASTSEKNESKPFINSEIIPSETKEKGNNITISINKNTTDAELKKISKLFKKNYNATVKFNGVKRNSSGEVTAIKVSMKTDKSSANYNEKDDEGINEFTIRFNSKKGSISIGNTKSHGMHFTSKNGNTFVHSSSGGGHNKVNTWISEDGKTVHEYKYDSDENHEGGNHEVIIINDEDHDHEGDNSFIFIDENGEITKDHDVKIIKNKGNNMFIMGDHEDMLIMIDGKEATKKQMENIGAGKIMNIEVIKGEEATKEYGKKAKNGVILINTKE